MISLELIGWNKGIKTVSLIEITSFYSTHSLIKAKNIVDQLLEGKSVTLYFEDEISRNEYHKKAENLGAVIKL